MLYLKLFLLAGLIWIFEIISFHVEDGRLHRSWFWWVCGMAIFREFIPTAELCLNWIWTEVLFAPVIWDQIQNNRCYEISLNCFFFQVGMLFKSTSVLKAITLLQSNLSAFPLLLLQIQTKVTTWVLFFALGSWSIPSTACTGCWYSSYWSSGDNESNGNYPDGRCSASGVRPAGPSSRMTNRNNWRRRKVGGYSSSKHSTLSLIKTLFLSSSRSRLRKVWLNHQVNGTITQEVQVGGGERFSPKNNIRQQQQHYRL